MTQIKQPIKKVGYTRSKTHRTKDGDIEWYFSDKPNGFAQWALKINLEGLKKKIVSKKTGNKFYMYEIYFGFPEEAIKLSEKDPTCKFEIVNI